MTHYLLNYWGR